jgi:hypothetical protein
MRGWASCALALFAAHADAAVDAVTVPDASPDAMRSTVHVYYLNFEGQALTMAAADDPAANKSSLIMASYTVPPFLANDAQRTTKIAAIVAEVQGVLAPYDVTVTTARPASGPYDMLVAGGTPQQAGLNPGVGSITSVDCNASDAHVELLFDVGFTQHAEAAQIVAMFGATHTIPQSTKPGDCMCYSNQACTPPQAVCTIGAAGTPVDKASWFCGAAPATMDENATWLAVFGAHP